MYERTLVCEVQLNLSTWQLQKGRFPTTVLENVVRIIDKYLVRPSLAVIGTASNANAKVSVFRIRLRGTGIVTNDDCAVGKLDKPILLKRGLANTLKELLMSAEYIMAGGNEKVILCERGIRTFDDYTRNTLDLAAVSMLRELTHLPIIVDPSHATGLARLVPPMAMAAPASGCDGLIIEVHNDPMHALCDGAQSLKPEEFDALMGKVRQIREIVQ